MIIFHLVWRYSIVPWGRGQYDRLTVRLGTQNLPGYARNKVNAMLLAIKGHANQQVKLTLKVDLMGLNLAQNMRFVVSGGFGGELRVCEFDLL